MTRPPLPEPALIGGIGDYREHYTADQMHAYADACVAEALERAAQQCEIVRHNSPLDLTYQDGCGDCANAIRDLKGRL